MRYTTRPLSDRAWLRPADERKPSQFKVTWTQALDLLERELYLIDGGDLVIEIDVREQDLRLDGMVRANARVEVPAVVVAFESRHGSLVYRSDQYAGLSYMTRTGMSEAWQHNVYAVALTLEALRSVDRWGAASAGEQYRGYRQIGGGPAIVTEAPMTDQRAADVLIAAAHPDATPGWAASAAANVLTNVRTNSVSPDPLIRLAQRLTHPDTRHPDASVSFDDVQRAAAHLRQQR